MRFSTIRSAFLTSTLFFAASVPVMAAGSSSKGCYSDATPLKDQGPYTFQSSGYCKTQCTKKNKAVYALYQGSNCLCGDEIPASSKKVSDDECNVSCNGYPSDKCGGDNAYAVYLTGESDDVKTYGSSSSTDSSSSTSTDGTVETSGGHTVTATAASETGSTDETSKDSGPNTAAIAAGVVVGVVGFCALVGAGFFLWRFRKRKGMQNEYSRNARIDNFGKPKSTSSMSDSRFDGDFLAQRRQSNGSIDDDQDFSRRILKVTNPDRS